MLVIELGEMRFEEIIALLKRAIAASANRSLLPGAENLKNYAQNFETRIAFFEGLTLSLLSFLCLLESIKIYFFVIYVLL